jgi:acyl-CoA synthetase (AMP-forming)/AMP-acid ligase II
MNTHRSFSLSALHQMFAAPYTSDEPIVNLVAAPMTHAAGTLTLPVSARGGTVVVMERPDPVQLLDLIEKHRVTELYLPPTVIYRLLDMPGIEQRDFSSLKYFIYGAAPMSVDKLRRAIEVFGPVMFQGYGQAEAPTAIAFLRPEEHFRDGEIADAERLSAAGRPAPLVRVEILDSASTILPAGETGEICVRGDLVMKGLLPSPGEDSRDHYRRLAAHRRHRLPRRRRFPAHHRPQEGHDHQRRIQRVSQRGRAGHLVTPCGAGLCGYRNPAPRLGEAVIAVVELNRGRN